MTQPAAALLLGTTKMGDTSWVGSQASPATAEALRYGRRLSDKLLIAFHDACDKRDIPTAEDLLGVLDRYVGRPIPTEVQDRRKIVETLADANYRLWDIKRKTPAT
jgi:hypothetical protein